jgi:hypothetical protein
MANRIIKLDKEPKNRRNTEPKPKIKTESLDLLILEEESPKPSQVKLRLGGVFVIVDTPNEPDQEAEN